MSKTRTRSRRRKTNFVQKPNGVLAPRVQAVGPERFGIVMVDVAKQRIQTQCCDFYGNEILPFAEYELSRSGHEACIHAIQQVRDRGQVSDLVIAIERTGEYHRPFQRAAQRAHFDVRIVHPLATNHFRAVAHPGNKTDPTDLGGIFRATVNGFGLIEPVLPDEYVQLQLLIRHRRDLVQKQTSLCCQIKETLHALMPGYEKQFSDLWGSTIAVPVARATGSAEAVLRCGVAGLAELVEHGHWSRHQDTFQKIVEWAQAAPLGHPHIAIMRRVLDNLVDDRLEKNRQILALERDIAMYLARTRFVRLLIIPGINVVSAADLAGEMGPVEHYANPNAITGRAGHCPARYQSDQVDCANGSLVRTANRRLRANLMQIADNLVTCNHHFADKAATWRAAHKDARWIRVKVAKIFSRIAYVILAGDGPFHHPCLRTNSCVIDKLNAFHLAHQTPVGDVLVCLRHAIEQLPQTQYAHEARPWQEELERRQSRRRGPQPLNEIILEVLARLGMGTVQSSDEGPDLS